MATEKAREVAAQVWCRPEASHICMDTELAEAFANTLDEQRDKQGPLLGLATTRELLAEISARFELGRVGLDYKTAGSDD